MLFTVVTAHTSSKALLHCHLHTRRFRDTEVSNGMVLPPGVAKEEPFCDLRPHHQMAKTPNRLFCVVMTRCCCVSVICYWLKDGDLCFDVSRTCTSAIGHVL